MHVLLVFKVFFCVSTLKCFMILSPPPFAPPLSFPSTLYSAGLSTQPSPSQPAMMVMVIFLFINIIATFLRSFLFSSSSLLHWSLCMVMNSSSALYTFSFSFVIMWLEREIATEILMEAKEWFNCTCSHKGFKESESKRKDHLHSSSYWFRSSSSKPMFPPSLPSSI